MVDACTDGIDVPTCYLDDFLLGLRDEAVGVLLAFVLREGILREFEGPGRFVDLDLLVCAFECFRVFDRTGWPTQPLADSRSSR